MTVRESSLLTDVGLSLRHHALRPVYGLATETRRVATASGSYGVVDLNTISGGDNLGQAIVMRLLTPRGELAALGHAEYGSRLHELVGTPSTETSRNLAKLYILESLAQEPRIAEVLELRVDPGLHDRGEVDVLLRVKPVGETGTVSIGPFTLEFAR